MTRNQHEITGTFPEIAGALATQGREPCVVDGEIVAFDGSQTRFERLQQRLGQARPVRPALPDSTEELFHQAGTEFLLWFDLAAPATEVLRAARLERAIGVIYRPQTERHSHYFHARVADQFGAVIHIDQTRALEALERTAEWDRGEAPETYPFAGQPLGDPSPFSP